VRSARLLVSAALPSGRALLGGTPAWVKLWYSHAMRTAIDRTGRVVIPAPLRARFGLVPGTELEIVADDISLRLLRRVPKPRLVRVGKRLIARPTLKGRLPSPPDLATLIEGERNRWPG
jgi:AbrB family looped-hinge helix DNA binding protein